MDQETPVDRGTLGHNESTSMKITTMLRNSRIRFGNQALKGALLSVVAHRAEDTTTFWKNSNQYSLLSLRVH